MVWKAKETRPEYPAGTNKLRRKFAYLPTYVDGNVIWLALYEAIVIYSVIYYTTKLMSKDVTFAVGKWTEVSKRLIIDK